MSMHWGRVFALVLRYTYLYRRSVPRLIEMVFWPVMDLLVWGFVTAYLLQLRPGAPGLVTFLIVYHLYCGRLMRDFAEGRNTRSHVWYRFFNEVPVLVLFACVFLVVLKPF